MKGEREPQAHRDSLVYRTTFATQAGGLSVFAWGEFCLELNMEYFAKVIPHHIAVAPRGGSED